MLLLHMLEGGQHLIQGQLTGDHPGVAGPLPERADMRLGAGGFLALLFSGSRVRTMVE
jgi:hypothetical protein